MGYVTDVQIGNNIYPVGSSLYGTCATEAGTAAKVVTMSNFDTLKTGVTIHVKFTYSNSVADPTLNVNNTGAKSIYRFATISPGSTIYEAWNAGAVVSFTYDGDAWIMNESMNYDATKLPLTGGTLSGHLNVQVDGEAIVKTVNNNSGGLTLYLDTATENHGLVSNGYYNSSTSTFTSDPIWMIVRQNNGNIYVNGHSTLDLPLTGGTLTGNLVAQTSGSNAQIIAKCADTGVGLSLHSDTNGTQGLWSPGYWNGTAYVADGKRLIYRDTAGNVYCQGHATLDLPLTGGTLTGNLTVQRAGETWVKVINTSSGNLTCQMDASTENHGIWSTGYYNNSTSTFTSDPKWMIYRNNAGSIIVNGHATSDLALSGGTMTGDINMSGSNINLKTPSGSSDDCGDIVFYYGNGQEKSRIWVANTYSAKSGPYYRVYNSSGTSLYSGTLPLADGTGASGTWNISAATAGALNTIASVSGSSHAVALQTYFNNNHANIPRNKLINFYSSAYNNGSLAMGYFLAGNDSSPYGGFFVAHYSNAYYVGISNGAYSEQKILTSTNYSGYALPLSGGTITGSISYKTSYNAAATNNGLSSGTGYPTTVNILDSSSRIMVRLEGVINSNGSIGSYWYVRNYDTSGTNTGQKGIAMHMAKNGTLTYTVGDPANFRSAISAFSTGGGTITGSLTIKPASGNAGIELYGTSPYIDFHHNNSTTYTDYCPRLYSTSESQLRLVSQNNTPQFCVMANNSNYNIAYMDTGGSGILIRRQAEATVRAQSYSNDGASYCQLYLTAAQNGVRGIYGTRWDGTNHWMMHFANNSSTGTFYGHSSLDLALTGGTLTGALTCNSTLAVVGDQTNTGWIFLRGSDPSLFFANNKQTSWTNRIKSVSANSLQQTSSSGDCNYQIKTSGTAEARCQVENGGSFGALLASSGYNFGLYNMLSGKTGWLIRCASNGTVTTSTSVSDIRLKENIEPTDINNALEIVNSMKIRQFDWKTDGTHQNIGFVADELEEIDEHLAFGGGLDEFGNLDKKNVDTFYLLGYLTKAIQELSAENEKLKARISDVERRQANG